MSILINYEFHFHPLALKKWKKLTKEIQVQFKKIIRRRFDNPHVLAAKLRVNLKNCCKIKLRQSGYRLVYQAEDHKLIITVIAVGKRNKS